ncbi:hypothetical protein WOLCODRAFT_33102, partial [Wolfiporia cocos MD-104 SS10]
LQEGLLHVSEALFCDLWCVLGRVDSLEKLRLCSPAELYALAEQIIMKYASSAAIKRLEKLPRDQQDDILYQATLFSRDMLDYMDFNDAMRVGDVGRMEDQLPRLLFRYVGGRNAKYAVEILELLQALHKEWTPEVMTFIMRYCWLANTTGHPDSFMAFDMLQEHNIRDIKHIFASMGPFATWEYIGKISQAIPTMRKVKDHVEADINHFRRGKSHTSPDKEEDVARLQSVFHCSRVWRYRPTRHLNDADKPSNILKQGSNPDRLGKARENWISSRMGEHSVEQVWQDSGE